MDVSAFTRLKTIGHGILSRLTHHLQVQHESMFCRCLWSFLRPREIAWQLICHEAGESRFGLIALLGRLTVIFTVLQERLVAKGARGTRPCRCDILKSASLVHSPGGAEWIVRLYYSFQDRDHLYLVSLHFSIFADLQVVPS